MSNPNKPTFFVKGSTSGEKALTKGQVDKLLENVDVLDHMGLLMLAIDGGIRRDDIIRIRAKDFNHADGAITFYEKKKKRTKTIYIGDRTATTLKMMIDKNRSEWLFPSNRPKKHLSSKTAYNVLNRYLKRLGIPARGFHSLRGTCSKLKLDAGWTVHEVAKLLGDRPETVQAHYTTPSDEEMKEKAKEANVL